MGEIDVFNVKNGVVFFYLTIYQTTIIKSRLVMNYLKNVTILDIEYQNYNTNQLIVATYIRS